jgi:hypothetical protein
VKKRPPTVLAPAAVRRRFPVLLVTTALAIGLFVAPPAYRVALRHVQTARALKYPWPWQWPSPLWRKALEG